MNLKKRYELQFDVITDRDIIEKLDSLPKFGKAEYIRRLIKKDIKKASR